MSQRLVKVAKELNVSIDTMVDFLKSKGFNIEAKPTTMISDEIFQLLINEFSKFKIEKISGIDSIRIWKPISFSNAWLESDTSLVDDIASSWFEYRTKLVENSIEYYDFIERLKREHAIETGIIERLYDLGKGLTETLINDGFKDSLLSQVNYENPNQKISDLLKDQLRAVDYIFNLVKDERAITVGVIKELHALITQNQDTTDGLDQFGNKIKLQLIKGDYKKLENNPTRPDGIKIFYAPPVQVATEIENLINIFRELNEQNIHPIITSAWMHHSFTIIHPFQDGNGRLARLISSLILIKNGYFPLTVNREESKVKYIRSLELADQGEPNELVKYFCEIQRKYIERALNIKEVDVGPLKTMQDIFVQKLGKWKIYQDRYDQKPLNELFELCLQHLNDITKTLNTEVKNTLGKNAHVELKSNSFAEKKGQHYYYDQIVKYAKKHDYYFNRSLSKAWITLNFTLSRENVYILGISLHHYGYDKNTIAIGSFLEYKGNNIDKNLVTTLPLSIEPHIISIRDIMETKAKNIRSFLDSSIALALAQISSELS